MLRAAKVYLAAYGSGGPPDGGRYPPWGSGAGSGARQRTGGGSAGSLFGGGATARPIPFGSSTSPSAQGGFLSSSLPTGWDNHPVGATPAKSSFLAARASGPGGGSSPMHASQSDPALSATGTAANAQRRSVHFGAQPSAGARSGPGANSWIAHAEHAVQSANTGSGMRRSRSEGDFVRLQSERSATGPSSFSGGAGAEPAARSFGRSDNRFGGRASAPAGFMMSAASAARSERAQSPPQETEDMQECLDILLGEGMDMDGDDDGGVFSFGFDDGGEDEGRPRLPSAGGGLSFG